ncbi:branched-chain amino acid ABC transporter permease [Treponema sp. J25]|uniref:branched-chain amino acid ABC transporter permease n=1 Tax=Treponema sp. J25 TaxID=2094121 RepID=UPI0010451A2A|nr:branched-chain amino acid ABC transporter permease [Treponema sp. J25]TCW61072.1 branched-chain amino acid ABC transporter permease [Treponema sp. J25]
MKQNGILKDIAQALLQGVWFVFLLFPLLVMKVSVVGGVASVTFRWTNIPLVFVAAVGGSLLWRWALRWNEQKGARDPENSLGVRIQNGVSAFLKQNRLARVVLPLLLIGALLAYPLVSGMYHTNVMISALIYVILALGLNIVVGLGGLLNLGYAAFFAVGAYTYGLLWKHTGPWLAQVGIDPSWLFWISLPFAGLVALLFGVLLSLPVLRLRGDYLAIITLAFGEIFRMVLQNSGDITGGATGISLIPRPWFFGVKLTPHMAAIYIYYITLSLVVFTIFVVRRIENSRVGRALEAMREDEIACEAMGIDLVKNKLITFALGAFWAGVAGVLLAAQTTYINPDSFTLWESIMVLMAVVIGGTGSIPGVIAGTLVLKLLPEYFRALAQYRMLLYGVAMIIVILFKSDGLIPRRRTEYRLEQEGSTSPEGHL